MEILQRALREALDRNAAETVRWTEYRDQHLGAKANIEEFKKSLEVDIMVPIGSKALMPGRLYHTNEIVVSHSGTYYSKCTAHKALEICEKRLNLAANRLSALEEEANLHRNQLNLPLEFDAFSSQEIIEEYDEEEEKKWQADHKKKMKEHKRKEAKERQNLTKGNGEDDVIQRLEELELMEELENELEAISEEDEEAVQAFLNGRDEQISSKKRISHFNERSSEPVSSPNDKVEVAADNENESLSSNSGDDDDDDVPAEFKEFERRTESLSNKEKLKLFTAKLDEVQDYVRKCTPRTIEEISHKTDMMFLSDHLLSAIETIEDELNCDRFLNGENVIAQDEVVLPVVSPPSVSKQTRPILKKRNSYPSDDEWFDSREKSSTTKKISFAAEDEVKRYDTREEPNKLFTKKITFASEDDVKPFDGRDEPRKISSTVIYDHGPVLNLNVNHSDAVFTSVTNEQSDVIRSPVDIYKQFAGCTIKETKTEKKVAVVTKQEPEDLTTQKSAHVVTSQPKTEPVLKEVKETLKGEDISEAKTEVKEMLDTMFGSKNPNEPDPLPEGNFVDAHEPKKRISLFKQRRQMKTQ